MARVIILAALALIPVGCGRVAPAAGKAAGKALGAARTEESQGLKLVKEVGGNVAESQIRQQFDNRKR